jgi:hypothetical protein
MSTNDPEFYQAPKFTPEQYQAPPRQRGCFFYGCIIAVVLALLVAILLAVLAFVAYRFFGRMVEEYTATAAEQLPKVEMSPEQRTALEDRVEAFRKAVESGAPIEPLVLSSDDLNALIEKNDELKGTVYVKIEGDEVKGRISFPLDKLQFGMVKGRYLNGEADLKVSLFDGELIVHIDQLEVNGKKPPEAFMTDLRKQNVAKDVAKDPDNAKMLRKLQSVEVKDGKVILKVRVKPGTPAPEAKGATPETKAAPSVEAPSPANDQPKAAPSTNGAPKAALVQPATKKS